MALKSKTFNCGSIHDWRFPDAPISGYHTATNVQDGRNLINQGHPMIHGRRASGGSWFMVKRDVKHTGTRALAYRGYYYPAYDGIFTHAGSPLTPIRFSNSQANDLYEDLFSLGAEAWAGMKPTAPDFSAGSSLYELREVPGQFKGAVGGMIRDINLRRKKLGDHKKWYTHSGEMYLAIQFGWVPLYKDIRDFTEAFNNKHKRLDQLIKDEGKSVYRRRNLKKHDSDESFNTSSSGGSRGNPHLVPYLVSQCYGDGWTHEFTSQYKRRTWCAGRFRYVLPPGPRTQGWKNMMYRRIMGGRLTPSQLYQVMPWSWFIDYFAGLGHFLDAVSPGVEERLICEYAYLMQSHETITTEHSTQYMVSDHNWSQYEKVDATRTRREIIKIRRAASPFGFGLNKEDFTPYQLSIMGALGLTYT